MANWVIRQLSDGLYWSDGGWREHVRDAFVWSQFDHDADALKDPLRRLCNESEEWVELDDAGQPVEAKPALAADESDTKPRESGCQCHWEEGDSPCRVHGGDDEPIPFRLTDTDERDNLIARIAVQYERAARHVRKAAKLEKRLAKVAP